MRLPLDGTWKFNSATKMLTHNGQVVRFSYYDERPSGIHRAVDVSALPNGSRVRAMSPAHVTRLGWDPSGWGHYIRYKTDAGFEILEAHLQSFAHGISVGARLTEGEVVALSDNSGNSTGPHLHTEEWRVPGDRSTSGDTWTAFCYLAPRTTTRRVNPHPVPNWANNYRQGNSGRPVMFIQWALGAVFPDGIFSSGLTAKVKAFQKAHGIPQSGVVGTRTGPLLARVTR